MKKTSNERKRYSAAEKRLFWIGYGVALSGSSPSLGRGKSSFTGFLNGKEAESYSNGYSKGILDKESTLAVGSYPFDSKPYKKTESSDVKSLGIKGKPIGIIPYDLGQAKCRYAEELKAQDLAKGKELRPEEYYHSKAWKALNIDGELKKRGLR